MITFLFSTLEILKFYILWNDTTPCPHKCLKWDMHVSHLSRTKILLQTIRQVTWRVANVFPYVPSLSVRITSFKGSGICLIRIWWPLRHRQMGWMSKPTKHDCRLSLLDSISHPQFKGLIVLTSPLKTLKYIKSYLTTKQSREFRIYRSRRRLRNGSLKPWVQTGSRVSDAASIDPQTFSNDNSKPPALLHISWSTFSVFQPN